METPQLGQKPLNLHKFLPGGVDESSSDPSKGEGQTTMIRRIAAQTVEAEMVSDQLETDEYGLPVKEMLGVVGHCIARGLYCSKNIAQSLRDEPDLRKKFGHKLPDEHAIRLFRRRFADQLKATLGKLYRADPSLAPTPVSPAEGNTALFQRQADGLVHDAAWIDNTKGRLG